MNVPKLRAPVILAHGLLGFDHVGVGPWVLANYFHGIPEVFSAAGNRVFVARVSPTGSIAERAAQLKEFIDRVSPGEPVHLFSHSMGGLDSRYMISCLGMADRVLSLTTLGTPHRGTAFADWGLRNFAPILQPFFDFLSIPYQAFFDLTTTSCEEFNKQAPDSPKVRYFSVVGRFRPEWWELGWHVPARLLEDKEGPNDGLVAVESARYGESCEVWDGDHLNLINWKHRPGTFTRIPEDRTPSYVGLVKRLADEGF